MRAQVDGVPVATAPVVPEGSSSGRRLHQTATSVFSITIIAPSTPGVHTIIGEELLYRIPNSPFSDACMQICVTEALLTADSKMLPYMQLSSEATARAEV